MSEQLSAGLEPGDATPQEESTSAVDPAPHHHGYIGDKQRYLNRLKRVEGQVSGIGRMLSLIHI